VTTDLVVHEPSAMAVLDNETLKFIANTEFVPQGLRGKLPAILACVATGRALGLPDMTALRSIHIIDGKATFSAELMVMLTRQRGHSIVGHVQEGVARITGTRVDNGDTITVEWTLAMADRAGLMGKSNWKKYPEAMLWARAVSQLCRALFADCFAGNTYTPEELGDDTRPSVDEEGEVQLTHADTLAVMAESATGSSPEPRGAAAPPPPSVSGESAQVASGDAQHEPDVPFGDDYDAPILPAGVDADKPPTKKQIDALNSLVGQLRNAGHITTLQLYQSMGREPDSVVDAYERDSTTDVERLRWSPLRDSLTRSEAHQLLNRLIPFADEKLPKDAA
jgi:hypothetical protein